MRRHLTWIGLATLGLALVCHLVIPDDPSVFAKKKEKKSSGEKVLAAAEKFLESLEPGQRETATFKTDDPERWNFHFIPKDRKGLPLKAMNEKQRANAMKLLRASLSGTGYKRAEQIRALEAVLFKIEGPRPNRSFQRDTGLYHVSIFGEPSKKGAWGWRYEGHHLSLNFSLADGELQSGTPLYLGINPTTVPDEERFGKEAGLRVLGKLEDTIAELTGSLDDEQKQAILGEGEPEEVKETEKARYEAKLPAGLPVAKLGKKQKKLLRRIITEHTRNLPGDLEDSILEEIEKADSGRIEIAWRGSLDITKGHSFLIHGPSFLVAYANFQNNARHIHTGMRTRGGEFGLD